MFSVKRKHFQLFRSQTNEHRGTRKKHMWIFPLGGLLALIWFLIRVIPKPSRASYPCQQAAFPLASGFVVWLIGAVVSITAVRKAKYSFNRARYLAGIICIVTSVALVWLALSITEEKLALADPLVTNEPIGTARGVQPGRVVWVHDPQATDWQGPGDGHWWQSNHTNQEAVDRMMNQALLALTGEKNSQAAWEKLFKHFNNTYGKGDTGYKPGEKITIKVNFVGCIWRDRTVDSESYDLVRQIDYMNTSPQIMLALLRQLVKVVGVKESDIAIGDTLGYFPNQYYKMLHDEFPQVHYLDHLGKFDRTAVKPSSVKIHWSCQPKDVQQDYVPASYVQADYLINLANLKSHTGAGITLCAKNHYGSLIRWPAQKGYYDLHPHAYADGMGKYRNLVDLMGHAHLGGKTLLYLIDGLYAGRHVADKAPRKWNSAPFNGDWTSSLFVSQDPVAIDSVAFDFLWAEWDDYPHKSGAEDYLHEAALADNPLSKIFYDPDHAGNVKRLTSLGVHEHWNNSKDKQYSRDLGTGKGIELLKLKGTALNASFMR